MLKPVKQLKRDILSLLHAFARRKAIVQRKYFLIRKIPEAVINEENNGLNYLMTQERDFLSDMLSHKIDFETGMLAQISTMA